MQRKVQLTRHGRPLLARYVISNVPRGRYQFEAVRAVFEDPFSLAKAELHLGTESALLVYPRLVDLERLFTQSGGAMQTGGRVLLRRTAGYDLHAFGSTSRASRCGRCAGGPQPAAER